MKTFLKISLAGLFLGLLTGALVNPSMLGADLTRSSDQKTGDVQSSTNEYAAETEESSQTNAAVIGDLTINQSYSYTTSGTEDSGENSWSTEIVTQTNTYETACPEYDSTHFHYYTNESGPTEDIWYSARATKFRIYLHNDFMENVDLNSIECGLGGHWISGCNGSSTADGGSQVNFIQSDTSSDVNYQNYIEWEYGRSDLSLSPELPGYNDYDGDGVIDTEDEEYRIMGEYLYYEFKDDIEEGSATTTSSIYLMFFYYDVETGEWHDSAGEDGETGYHWNSHTNENISYFSCPSEAPTCTSLQVTPNTTTVNDLFTNFDFEVTAYDGTEEITDELTYTYRAYSYDTTPNHPDDGTFAPTAEANFLTQWGSWWVSTMNPYLENSSKTEIRLGTANPGDTITVVADGFEDVCYAKIEFPFCYDLTINEPAGDIAIINGTDYETPIDVSVTARKKSSFPMINPVTGEVTYSYEEDWPYLISYESTDSAATFDGSTSIYTPDPQDLTIDSYQSGTETSATVEVYAQPEQDIAGRCSDAFTYTLTNVEEITCDFLDISQPPTDITVEEMNNGNVMIHWDSFMTDGTPTVGPWEIWSTPAGGTFTQTDGTPLTAYGSHYLTPYSEVLYTGNPGDTITVRDILYPACEDSISSLEEEFEYYCDTLTLDGPYLADGTFIDTTVDADIVTLYDENYACFPFEVQVDDMTYSNDLIAQSSNSASTIELTVNETGPTTTSGLGSTSQTVTGFTSYTGEVCVTDYAEFDHLEVYMNGEIADCYADFTFPELPEEEMACEFLGMSPNRVVMAATDTDAGTVNITIKVAGDNPSWRGDLRITATNPAGGPPGGDLYYPDGSIAGPFLVMPVSGLISTFNLTYVGGQPGDIITAYINGEEVPCLDQFRIYQEEAEYCELLYFDTGIFNITENDIQDGSTTLTLESDLSSQTLIVEYSGCSSEIIEYDGASYNSPLTLTGLSGSDTFDLNFVGLCESAVIRAYVSGWEEICEDTISVQLNEEVLPACIDLSFDTNTVQIEGEGESLETTLTLNSDLENQTLVIDYTGCTDGQIVYDGNNYDYQVTISGVDGSNTFDVQFTNLCTAANISAYISEDESCADTITVTEDIPEAPICYDLSFNVDELNVVEDEDFETTLTLNSDLEDQTLIIEYSCDGDIEVEYNGTAVSGSETLEIEGIDGDETFDVTFTDMCEDPSISAYIEDAPECADEITPNVLQMGNFEKYIFTFNFAAEKNSYSDEGVFFSHDDDRAFYTLEYDPAGTEDAITFTDEMWNGNLRGFLGDGSDSGGYIYLAENYGELTSDAEFGYSTIEKFGFGSQHELYSDEIASIVKNWSETDYHTFVPYVQYDDGSPSEIIPECEYDYEENEDGEEERVLDTEEACYNPDYSPETTGSVVIENAGEVEERDDDAVIRIRYVGIVISALICSSQTDDCLLEEFQNDAEVEVYETIDPLEASARLVVLCSYLVTRNAGDVYLEVGLEGGSDISCIFANEDGSTSSDYSNTDGVVVQDSDSTSDDSDSDDVESTLNTSYSSFTVSFCDDESDGSLISNLSSYVCEIVTSVSDLWKKTSVEQTTDDRITQSTRNVVTNQTSGTNYFSNWNDLKNTLQNQNNPDSGILYFDGSLSNEITLAGIEIPHGAWTLIVENATLKITGDITYTATTDYTNMPSMAFVVTGGDIYVQNTAQELSGVYYTDQSFTGNERSAVNEPLTFYGSIYGHIQPLLDAARYVGPPTLDGGGIVVRYDSRIILNTPPGLSEYVDVDTQQGVN